MKGILKNQDSFLQRSSSVGPNQIDEITECISRSTSLKSANNKKRALIYDQNVVSKPGEIDENWDAEESKSSVVDRNAAERISYRLIQQRSLDYGLYQSKKSTNEQSFNRLSIKVRPHSSDEDSSSMAKSASIVASSQQSHNTEVYSPDIGEDVITDADEEADVIEDSNTNIADYKQGDESPLLNDAGDNIEVAMYRHPKIDQIGKQITLKDILAHRVPELEVDLVKDESEGDIPDNFVDQLQSGGKLGID